MTEPQHFDPTRYAADALERAGITGVTTEAVTDEDPKVLVEHVVQAIAQTAPLGWESLHAAFSMAGGQEIANVLAVSPDGPVQIPITSDVLEPIRTHRSITVGPQGPWLRLLFDCDNTGALQVAFDYGDNELPADQLLPSEAYLRDFEQYPRADAPVWLLAYIGNEGQQMRSAAQARQNATAGMDARPSDDEIPPLPKLWARMAVLAAVCRGSDAPVGPRVDPSFELYLGDNGSCTVARLPGDRAVLSGGRNDSRLLAAAYKGVIPWPDLYRGAPQWLHNLYLDPRTSRGFLSFCYWWDGKGWYRSDLPEVAQLTTLETPWKPTDEIARGMPGIWTVDSTATMVANVLKRIGIKLTDRNSYAATDLVRAAEARVASERYLVRLFPEAVPANFDLAEALAQLDAANVLLPEHPPIDQATAKSLVVEYCRAGNVNTTGYPLDRLVAGRIDGGWQVFVPVEPGEIAIGRMTFLVADDGAVDQTSTSAPPDEQAFLFASRFAARIRDNAR